ncbi:Hpt domain-containing protein [Sphingobacterium rhinopitheci]|uniref:Hpt domain-containing protein n=1 Tax=Sphingobacterium rhinopitheci TaxID=2781960 RepID=UPI001F51BB80|nr:Hpt domain-containing protein [Sphingobacterium rhinopitheci]MCI0920208.1 Hpt domain-containing protein [Sphingobacterium rhinopitheci]
MKNYKIINPTVIHESMMNNDSMVKQFVELYIAQCPLDFEALAQTIKQGDHKAISSAAHHIKPTMEYIGASNLRAHFQELEKLGSKESDIADIIKKFEEIKPKFELMLEELRYFNT